ncbi:MAG: hypothetical protein ABJ251_09870 [Paracoccaceae bacterium]
MRKSKSAFTPIPDHPEIWSAQKGNLRCTALKLRDGSLCLYSPVLRHAFEDRMLAAKFPERVKADLMGHDINRERYGSGLSLSQTAALLDEISF